MICLEAGTKNNLQQLGIVRRATNVAMFLSNIALLRVHSGNLGLAEKLSDSAYMKYLMDVI